jgi:hypothetical protein
VELTINFQVVIVEKSVKSPIKKNLLTKWGKVVKSGKKISTFAKIS